MAPCSYNECCEGCGKVKIYVDCQTGEALNTGPDLNVPSQEVNHSASSINTGTTNVSKNDIQGSIIDNDESGLPPPPAGSGVPPSAGSGIPPPAGSSVPPPAGSGVPPPFSPSSEQQSTITAPVIEYHNHYYGYLQDYDKRNADQLSKMNIPHNDALNTQQGTVNPYRKGGYLNNTLENQTHKMNYGLSQRQDPSDTMNYGQYGTLRTSTTMNGQPQMTATGMFMETTTQPYNSLYSLKF